MFFLFPNRWCQLGRCKCAVLIKMEFWVKHMFLPRCLQDCFLEKMTLVVASPLNRLYTCKWCCKVLRVFDVALTHLLMYCVYEPIVMFSFALTEAILFFFYIIKKFLSMIQHNKLFFFKVSSNNVTINCSMKLKRVRLRKCYHCWYSLEKLKKKNVLKFKIKYLNVN